MSNFLINPAIEFKPLISVKDSRLLSFEIESNASATVFNAVPSFSKVSICAFSSFIFWINSWTFFAWDFTFSKVLSNSSKLLLDSSICLLLSTDTDVLDWILLKVAWLSVRAFNVFVPPNETYFSYKAINSWSSFLFFLN